MKLRFTLEIEPEDLAEFLKALPVSKEEPIIIPPVKEESIPEIPTPPIEVIENEAPLSVKPAGYLTLEDFGGNGYYKRIDKGLDYSGNIIRSDSPIFTSEDLGKSFCGLFAHKNPQEINYDKVDEYYPNILGSRYSKIIEVIDSKTIKVDFEYNSTSGKGYVFFDNSDAYSKLLDTYIKDDSIGIWMKPDKTYVIVQTEKKALPTHKDFIIKTNDESKGYLKIGVEDYFQWNKGIGKPMYKNTGHLFEIGVSDKNFISKNICYLPPHRRVPEAQPTGMRIFGGSTGNIGEQKRTLAIIGNTALDEMRSIGENVTDEIFSGISLGVIYSGGTYTGDGSKITDDVDDYLTVYIKDFEHEGPNFCDLKANTGGGLLLVAEDIYTNFLDEEKYSPTAFKGKGKFTTDYTGIPITDKTSYPSHLLEITSDNSFYQSANLNGTRGWGNASNIIHIDRFVFWQPTGNYWKYLYETWFNKGIKNKWIAEENGCNFFTGKKIMMHSIPQKGNTYTIGRKYNQEGNQIKDYVSNKIKGMVNWAAVQGVGFNEVKNIPANAQNIQFQPGDKFKILGSNEVYTVQKTEREIYPLFEKEVLVFGGHDSIVSYFPVYTLDKNLPESAGITFEIQMIESSAEYLLNGEEFEFYSSYKANRNLTNHTADTKFGDANILQSNPFGHVSYNHDQVNIWAKNWKHNGFFRQSVNNYNDYPVFKIPEGETSALRRWAKIHTYINCTGFGGQFDPSFNFKIRDLVYKSIGMKKSDYERVRLYGCNDMNGLENRNDSLVVNLPIDEAPENPIDKTLKSLLPS